MHIAIEALMAVPAPCEKCKKHDICMNSPVPAMLIEITYYKNNRSGKPIPTDIERYFPIDANMKIIEKWIARFGSKLIHVKIHRDRFQASDCRAFSNYYLGVK